MKEDKIGIKASEAFCSSAIIITRTNYTKFQILPGETVALENSSPEGNINPFLTAEEVAQYLRLPLSTVYRLAQTAVIPSFKVGKHWRFRRDTLEKWISQQENHQGDQ